VKQRGGRRGSDKPLRHLGQEARIRLRVRVLIMVQLAVQVGHRVRMGRKVGMQVQEDRQEVEVVYGEIGRGSGKV